MSGDVVVSGISGHSTTPQGLNACYRSLVVRGSTVGGSNLLMVSMQEWISRVALMSLSRWPGF